MDWDVRIKRIAVAIFILFMNYIMVIGIYQSATLTAERGPGSSQAMVLTRRDGFSATELQRPVISLEGAWLEVAQQARRNKQGQQVGIDTTYRVWIKTKEENLALSSHGDLGQKAPYEAMVRQIETFAADPRQTRLNVSLPPQYGLLAWLLISTPLCLVWLFTLLRRTPAPEPTS